MPYFTPDYLLNLANLKTGAPQKGNSIESMKNAPLAAPRLVSDEDRAAHDEEHQVP